MDFLKLIRSIEELLFEAMAWLIYYPRTLWLIVRHPLRMMDYSDHEQRMAEVEQYDDTLSPPLLLLFTIVLTHLLALGAASTGNRIEVDVTSGVFGSHENLVLARSLAYAIFPLTAAVAYLRRTGGTYERKRLRPPFYGQCYLMSPYAVAVSLSALAFESSVRALAVVGGVLALVSTVAYLGVQTAQYRRCLALGTARALGLAVRVYLEALIIVFVIGAVAVLDTSR